MTPKHAYNDEDLLPVSKAAAVIGVHAQTLRNYEKAGHIPAIRTIGGERRFRFGDLMHLRENPPELYKRKGPRTVSVEESAEGFRIREPEQNPTSLTVRGEPDLAFDGEALPADRTAQDAPLGSDARGEIAEGLLGDDLDGIGVGFVSRLGLKAEPVGTDGRDVALPEVGSLDGDVDVTAANLEVGAHGAQPTDGVRAVA